VHSVSEIQISGELTMAVFVGGMISEGLKRHLVFANDAVMYLQNHENEGNTFEVTHILPECISNT
jgi:hypothetical protein